MIRLFLACLNRSSPTNLCKRLMVFWFVNVKYFIIRQTCRRVFDCRIETEYGLNTSVDFITEVHHWYESEFRPNQSLLPDHKYHLFQQRNRQNYHQNSKLRNDLEQCPCGTGSQTTGLLLLTSLQELGCRGQTNNEEEEEEEEEEE